MSLSDALRRFADAARALADEMDHSPASLPVPASEPKRKRARTYHYKPKHTVTEDDVRAIRRQAAKRGIAT